MLTCWDFQAAGLRFECCSSCHNEDEEYWDDEESPAKPNDFRTWRERSRVWLYGNCCGWNSMKFTRNDWANAVRARRQRTKNNGG